MIRILFLLVILVISDVKTAKAQSNEVLKERTCDTRIESLTEDSVIALSQDELVVSRRFIERKNDKEFFDLVSSDLELKDDPEPQILADTIKNFTTDNFETSPEQEVFAMTEPRIALAEIPLPSLWWAKKQFDPFDGRLISDWFTYPQLKQIDITVNWQLWTLLDYLGRYRFINQFGTVTRQYGYTLRVFNQQQQCLALYEYDDTINPPKWEIKLEGLGQDSLQIEPSN